MILAETEHATKF